MRERLIELQCLAYDTFDGGKTSFEHTADVLLENGVVALPSADVVEVKRGEWIKKFKYSHGYDDYYNTECSLCGYKVEKSGVGDKLSLDNFCPNCGAKMDGTPKERGGEK